MLLHSNTHVPDEELYDEKMKMRYRACAHMGMFCVNMYVHVSAHVFVCMFSRGSNPVPVCACEHSTAKLYPSNVW